MTHGLCHFGFNNLSGCLFLLDHYNGHDPYAYLKDVLQRLPTHKNHLIAELLPHRWQPLHI